MTESVYGAKKTQKGFDGRPESFTDPWKALIDKASKDGKPFLVKHIEHIRYKELMQLIQELTRRSEKSNNYRWMLHAAREEWKNRQP